MITLASTRTQSIVVSFNADFLQLLWRPDSIGTIGKSWEYVLHVDQVATCSMYWLEMPRIAVFSVLYWV
jgi:hypothetical protein